MPKKTENKKEEIPLASIDAGLSLDKAEKPVKNKSMVFPAHAFVIDQKTAEGLLRDAWRRVVGKCDNVVYLGKHDSHEAVIRHAINALKAEGTLYLPGKLSKFVKNLEEVDSSIKGFVAFRRV